MIRGLVRMATVASLLPGASIGAMAADCARIDDDAERLRCYDLDAGRPARRAPPAAVPPPAAPNTSPPTTAAIAPPALPAAAEEPSWLMTNLKIRDVLEGSKKGASLSATRQHGDTTYVLKAAALLDLGNRFLPDAAAMEGWAWKLGAQVAKDTSATKPVDGRTFALGATGNLFGASPVVLVSSLDLQSVNDRVAHTRDLGLRYSGTVVLPDWRILDGGLPYNRTQSGHYIFPVVGLHVDRHRADSGSGNMFGGHVGVGASYYPGGTFWRFHVFGDAVRARDFTASGDAVKRGSTYYDWGVEYAFIDPLSTKQTGFIPTLSLKRVLGSNFLTGEADTAKTVLSFTLRLN